MIIAATLLQLFAAPLILLTVIVVVVLLFVPLLLMMAEVMKANHLLSNHRRSPKCMLYKVISDLLALELIVGGMMGMMGMLLAMAQLDSAQENLLISDVFYFLLILLTAGFSIIVVRKYILGLAWWSKI